MIRINLARDRATANKKIGSFSLPSFNFGGMFRKPPKPPTLTGASGQYAEASDSEGASALSGPLARVLLLIIAGIAGQQYVQKLKTDALEELEQKFTEVDRQREAVQRRLGKIKGFEPVKKQLEEDEQSIRRKLAIVNKLLQDRADPGRMLLQMAQVIPEDVWLTEFQFRDDKIKISGSTTGYGQASDFIKALSSSRYFSQIELKNIQESLSQSKDQRVQNFELSAVRKGAKD